MLSRSIPFAIAFMMSATAIVHADEAPTVDAAIKPYSKTSGVSGRIKSVGSDTMNNEMALWGDGFKKLYPNVMTEIEGKGSSTAPPALTEGTAQFGAMSRPMKAKEVDHFESSFGYKPTAVRTSIDCIAVFLHKDNPLEGLTLSQVDAIFSKTRRGGAPRDITTWGDLGLTGAWSTRPISLYGRNSASGTYGYFKSVALFKGDYKDQVKEQPGSSSVIQAVASDRFAIGYSGIGYKTADVRAVPLAVDAADGFFGATLNNAYAGDYPLARFLLLYVNKHPIEAIDPLRLEFLKFVLSREGQQEVIKAGYIPLPANIAEQEVKKLK